MLHCKPRIGVEAVGALREIVGSDHICTSNGDRSPYEQNCTGHSRSVLGVVAPATRDEVVEIVKLACQYQIKLYPISTGHNWGYGSATPVQDACLIVDLSRMDKIVAFDEATGVVTLEPGVTQQTLRTYLDTHGYQYMVPTTGGGPDCSLVGNALERGFGITPISDHFSAVISLQAVLSEGLLYESSLTEMGACTPCLKWGIGPYLDGLFSQHGLGIVTQMSLALAPKPECISIFLIHGLQDDQMEDLTERIRRTLQVLGANLGGINILNSLRCLSMIRQCPTTWRDAGLAVPETEIASMAKQAGIGPWTAVGTVYGSKRVVRAVKAEVRSLMGTRYRVRFLNPTFIRLLSACCERLPFVAHSYRLFLRRLAQSLDLLAGLPQRVVLPLVKWRSRRQDAEATVVNPDNSDYGLIWYTPIISLNGRAVTDFVAFATSICRKYGLDPLLTFTAYTDRFVCCSLPLLFSRDAEEEVQRAHQCYEALLNNGLELGFVPYRTGISSMARIMKHGRGFWHVQKTIKDALDPGGIFSPGRYCERPLDRAAARRTDGDNGRSHEITRRNQKEEEKNEIIPHP